jgi:predicted small lipoprotein YifL
LIFEGIAPLDTFFYGDRKPRFVDHSKPSRSSKTSRRKTQKEFEITFEALPESNFRVSSTDWKTSSDWLFESPLPSTPAYTQCDFIDPRIDVDAQYALFEMLKGDIPTRTAAISMLSAVKNGSLGGIYKENQQVPAKRAQRIGKTWWTLIPSGQSAICVTQPSSETPIIAFKRSLTNRLLLGQALKNAWTTCGVTNPLPYPPSGKSAQTDQK